jgi:hypothetical protein
MRNKYLVILFKKNKEDICLLVFFFTIYTIWLGDLGMLSTKCLNILHTKYWKRSTDIVLIDIN